MAFLMWSAVLGLAAFAVLSPFWRRRGLRLPPGPRPWPVIGNLYHIKPIRFRCFAEWAAVYGPVMSVWCGTTLCVVVSSAEMAREVLKEKDQLLADRPRNRSAARASRDGTDLIWADYGPHYAKLRKVCTMELFSPKRIEALRPIREDEVTAMVDSIYRETTRTDKLRKSLVLRSHLSYVAFNNITRLAFGKRFIDSEGLLDEQGKEFKAIQAIGFKFGTSSSLAEYIPWIRWMFPLDEAVYAEHRTRKDRLTRAIMAEHNETRKKSGVRQHFVDALHTVQEKYDLSNDTVFGLLWNMIAAGMDTTAISVEWAMAEILKNPTVLRKAQEELDRVIGTDRIMTESDFPNLPYLQCVVKESLRLHPPTPLMLPHKAAANVTIGGYDIPKGSNIHVNVWAIARDPKVWDNSLEFRPERFNEENVDIRGHDFRVLPFGSGRRMCPGAQLAINLVQSMLGHLLHQFEWSFPDGVNAEEVDMSENPGMSTFMATPLEVVASIRLPVHLYNWVPADM